MVMLSFEVLIKMNQFAISYEYIDTIIKMQQEHNLSEQEIEALETAKKSLLLVELLGLSVQKII